MQDNYEAPVTGSIKVPTTTAQVVADFLLVFLRMSDSPLTGDQIAEFSEYRDLVKAGPVEDAPVRTASRPPTRVLADGITIGNGPRMLLDRNLGVKFLRSMISGEHDVNLMASFKVALLDAIASNGPKKNNGIHGKYCQGTFGYVDPQEAKEYLCGQRKEILVSRAKHEDKVMPTYMAETPNSFLQPDKVWTGPKDHVKTKFTAEEMKNQ